MSKNSLMFSEHDSTNIMKEVSGEVTVFYVNFGAKTLCNILQIYSVELYIFLLLLT